MCNFVSQEDSGTRSSRRLFGTGVLLLSALALAACSSSSSDSGTPPIVQPPANNAPVANAGSNQTVFEAAVVQLSGSASSDPDGNALTYAWAQTGGPAVTINNASQVDADFVAPDVAAGTPATLTFDLIVSDGTASDTASVSVNVEENVPPVANAGPDRNVVENTDVTLNGSASSDANSIGTLSYAWSQVGGTAVVLTGADTAQPTFTAPDTAAGVNEVLEFELSVSDGVFSATDTVEITVEEAQTAVTISGKVNYEFVPTNNNCQGLDFASTQTRPIRGAVVQLIDASSNAILGQTSSSDAGDYSFSGIPVATDVHLRVRAQLKRTGTPAWDVDIRDNVDTSGSPPPLVQRPLYVVDGPEFSSGGSDQIRNMTATTGWGSGLYTGDRSAAPFAILDAVYTGMNLILSADPNAVFPALDVYWNVNNSPVDGDIEAGDIRTSYYTSDPEVDFTRNPSVFLLGDANADTEEFDSHIIVHEWTHYLEDNLSRSDSIGGPHAIGQVLDARTAFSEGLATAIAGMALDDPLYCDTRAVASASGSSIDIESGDAGIQGWFNELSIVTLIYDLFDTDTDGVDNGSIGFAPIYETLVGPQTSTAAFTTIFSFATDLRAMLAPADQAFLDAQLARENIMAAGLNIWGSAESNDANGGRDVLPLYTDMTANGSVTNICLNSDFESESSTAGVPERTGNKLAEHRLIRLQVPTTDTYNVVVEATTIPPTTADPNDRDYSDPDVFIYRNGELLGFGNDDSVPNEQVFTTQLSLIGGATHVVDLEEWRFNDAEGAPDNYPEQMCFDVSISPTP